MSVDKLVDSTQLDADLTSVANAIRTKSGGSSQLAFPSGFISEIGNIPSGGGGGSAEQILASGTYTLSSDITVNLVIPVSITGNFSKITKIFVAKDSITSGVRQTLAWLRLYEAPSEVTSEIPYITELKYCDANGTPGYEARSVITASTIYVDSQTDPTKITCVRYSNNFHIKADDYHWYIYGIR